jgi:hypothetical protein
MSNSSQTPSNNPLALSFQVTLSALATITTPLTHYLYTPRRSLGLTVGTGLVAIGLLAFVSIFLRTL